MENSQINLDNNQVTVEDSSSYKNVFCQELDDLPVRNVDSKSSM